MRTYIVKAGDSPASISSRDDTAGCPKCSIDLVRANPHKKTVTFPNGFVSFKELRVGEQLTLPEKWFEPGFDILPPAYFGSLPYADGVTPSPFGTLAPVILRDFKALDMAADALRALAVADDRMFSSSVGDVATAINSAYQPALGNVDAAPYVYKAQQALRAAIPGSKMAVAFAASGLSATAARAEVQRALASALLHAQYAVGKLYGSVQPP